MNTNLVEYSTAQHIASVYKENTTKIRQLLEQLGECTSALRKAFFDESGYHFGFSIHYQGKNYTIDKDYRPVDGIFEVMKREAWSAIIAKLNVRRLMSASRAKELDESLQGWRGSSELPEIDPDMIVQVVQGYVASTTEFLEEAVKEEFDFWRPHINLRDEYKTNQGSDFALQRKLIKGWMVQSGYKSAFNVTCSERCQHITALDNIMHMLDGKGPVESYRGPLYSAIDTTKDGTGSTEYFKFKCFKNGNLHLEFTRADLLAMFNKIAGSNRLPSK